MEYVHILNKIKLLFDKITEPNYVMNNYYADSIMDKIINNCKDPEISQVANAPHISDLIVQGLKHTDNAHDSVRVFIIRMLAVSSANELHFAKMFAKSGEKIKNDFSGLHSSIMSHSLRVAYMEVALSLINHTSGVAWLLETGVWKEVLSLRHDKITVFVLRQKYKFAAKFLWKLNDLYDEANLKMVLSILLNPIFEADLLNTEMMTNEFEAKIIDVLEPILQILLSIVSENNRIEKSTLLINLLIKEFSIITHLYILSDRLRNESICGLIAKLVFWMIIAKIFLAKPIEPGLKYNMDDFMELGVTYFNIMQFFVQRGNPILILDFCNTCNLIWMSVWRDKLSKHWVRDFKKTDLQHQLLFICLVPLFVYIKKAGRGELLCDNECLKDYISKLLNSSCIHTGRAAYALRDLISDIDGLSVTLYSVKRLTSVKNHLNDEQANIMFQALFYVLKEYVPTDEYGNLLPLAPENFEESQEKVFILTYVLDTVYYLVKNHNINWHESLEIICLYNVVYNILQRSNLTCKFVVTALNVISMTVKKFLPPNLSLLMESKPGSAMHELGKLIYMKMHDMNWEVRDSALELLLVCTEISYIKFPPFQKQIIDNNLINVAATIAFNDHEFYVQVSALKCIGAASKITAIWDMLLSQYPYLPDKLISVLRNNHEGIVRKEACNVLCWINQNVKLSPSFKQILYEHMVSSALTDFHWEVQLCALKFWKVVIRQLQANQGMLDGTFPPVTFSKETRKIVNLNEAEIQRRLRKMLDELSSMGCLTVLVKLLNEDYEVEIMETALGIYEELMKILDQYKVTESIKPVEGEPMSVDQLKCFMKEENDYSFGSDDITERTPQEAENILEGILNSYDVNLLASMYEKQMKLKNDATEAPVSPKIKLIKPATPYVFVNYFKKRDFRDIIEQKIKWKSGIRSLPSLLDDVLGTYENTDDVNSLDCY